MTAEEGLNKFIDLLQREKYVKVLDIGCGTSKVHTKVMQDQGLSVSTCDIFKGVDYQGDYNQLKNLPVFEGIWASHILEHQLNVNKFLKKIHSDLIEQGYLCITVPPLKHQIVGGHVTLWNAGLLIYNLVLAGFDCSSIKVKQYGYNISIILQKKSILKMPQLTYDTDDLTILKEYFPAFKCSNYNSFNGNITEYNWL